MDCPECVRLKYERDKARRRVDDAVRALQISKYTPGADRAGLKIKITESRLYLQMADAEIARHERLVHQNNAVMVARG